MLVPRQVTRYAHLAIRLLSQFLWHVMSLETDRNTVCASVSTLKVDKWPLLEVFVSAESLLVSAKTDVFPWLSAEYLFLECYTCNVEAVDRRLIAVF